MIKTSCLFSSTAAQQQCCQVLEMLLRQYSAECEIFRQVNGNLYKLSTMYRLDLV